MFNFFHNLGVGIISTVFAITGIFHQAPSIATSTLPARIATSSILKTIPKPSVITPAVKQEITKPSTTDNSAQIQAQLKIKEKADADAQALLKAKADQDILVAQQKADAQAKLDAQNAVNLAEQQAQNAANIAAAQRAAQQQAINEVAQAKQAKLDAINLQIANLNAKYASDSNNMRNNPNISSDTAAGRLRNLYNQYIDDYNSLSAQYQQVQYSN